MAGIRKAQVCARCRNHGVQNCLKGHKKICVYKHCGCNKCLVTRDRQSFIAKEIAMHRYEIKSKSDSDGDLSHGLKLNFVRSKRKEASPELEQTPSPTSSRRGEVRNNQMCSRCRNHGIDQLLRGHKNVCAFAFCDCARCEITKRRREIMARQIKDYRSLRISAKSALVPEVVYATAPISPETVEMPQSPTSFDKTHSGEQFVDYEPVENRDLFFMLQSLFEKYGSESAETRIQLIFAFVHSAKGNWDEIEKSLEKGKGAEILC
jgi:DM DNA binding domain